MSDLFNICTRRTFLKAACSTALLASTGCGFSDNKREKIAAQLMDSLDHPERARMIGDLYFEGTPDSRDLSVAQWTERALDSLGIDADSLDTENLSSLDERIRQQVRRDFTEENVVVVKGFLLSQTEIMLCALTAAHAAAG